MSPPSVRTSPCVGVALLEADPGVVVSYVHNAVTQGLGKIGVLVALESSAPADKLEPLGKQLAMHIAAANPQALHEDDVDPATVERERAIAAEKASTSGKPADIIAKMVEGAVAKFRKEVALLSQLFVIDNKTKIADVLTAAGKDLGAPVKLAAYVRFQLGEGHREGQFGLRRGGRSGGRFGFGGGKCTVAVNAVPALGWSGIHA